MNELTQQQVLNVLRNGNEGARVEFVKSLPANSFKDAALSLVTSNNPGTAVVAIVPLIQQYSYGSNPACGALLAAAAHERALEIWESVPNHGLLLETLSNIASCHAKALTLLGRSDEVLDVTRTYIALYESLGDQQNLPSLRALQIEALINLKRIDQADDKLQDDALLQHPVVGMEARRLKKLVSDLKKDPTGLASNADPAPVTPGFGQQTDILKTAIGMAFEGDAAEDLKNKVAQLDPGNRFDASNPQHYQQMLDALGQAEQYFTKGGEDSELTVRSRIRNVSSIFVHGTPEANAIEESLEVLESCLIWSRYHAISELVNDALWGIYLCNSRLQRPSEAADALIDIRGNLEAARQGIKNPLMRGGIFGTYRYLFNAMCEQLHKAGRAEDLLEAIESSKGRVIADKLTEQADDVIGDAAIYDCVARLPELARSNRFHYLTYFVDEEYVYAVIVSKGGDVHLADRVTISEHELRDAAANANPGKWGKPRGADPSERFANVAERLAPLVSCLDTLLDEGALEKGDHICYSSDDDFRNVPLQYLKFRDGILLDWFSVSRVQTAFHLDRVLQEEKTTVSENFIGYVVPLKQDLEKPNGKEILTHLDAPLEWLAHKLTGETIRLEEATLERVLDADALDHRIVHFSTHGWFPKSGGNPFDGSYLQLATDAGLPDAEDAAKGRQIGDLTPRRILDAKLDLKGSHVSTMACVSGLAKEGIAGDALGLDWAFIQAGASSLISTHWEVSASCAARFFELFYQKWIDEKQSRARAIRETMRELLSGETTERALQQWSAFSLTGDFR